MKAADITRRDMRELLEAIAARPAPVAANRAAALVRKVFNFGLDRWTPHDLRRTAATHMSTLGVSRVVLGQILNHADTGITAVYDRASYDAAKHAALDAWAARLREIVAGRDNVIPGAFARRENYALS